MFTNQIPTTHSCLLSTAQKAFKTRHRQLSIRQVQKTDKYIPREADYIKRAIEDEQAIQLLKDELEETSKVRGAVGKLSKG